MLWLPLLLATLADSEQQQARRGRLQQLRGRLGLAGDDKPRGTAARLAWIEATYGLAVRQGLEFFLLQARQVGRPQEGIGGIDSWSANPGVFFKTPRGLEKDLHRSWKADPPLTELYFSSDDEPFVGLHFEGDLRVELDDLIPWLGLQIHRRLSELGPQGPRYISAREAALRVAQGIQIQLQGNAMDFLEAERPADLMSLSVDQVLALSEAWHDRFANTAGFGTPARPGVVVYRWPDGSTLQRLVTRQQLEQEGLSMGHCVGTFWSQVRDDESLVFSYRLASGLSVATMEILRDEWDPGLLAVEQLYGPRNEPLPQPVRDRIWAWVISELGLNGRLTSNVHLPDEIQAAVDRDGLGLLSKAELEALSSSPLRTIASGLYDIRSSLEAAWAMNELASRSWTPAQLAALADEGGWAYVPTVEDFRRIEQTHLGAIPDAIDGALGRLARLPVPSDHPTDTWYALRRRSDLTVPGWTLWNLSPNFKDTPETSWTLAMRGGTAPEVEFRLYAPGWWISPQDLGDARRVRTLLDDFTVTSDIGPLRALRDARLLLTASEASEVEASATAAERTGQALLPKSAVLGSLLNFLRAVQARNIELDRDTLRLLRSSR